MKVAFYTLGCKVNQYETNLMTQQFIEAGYDVAQFDDKADVYVINSCSVTNLSTRKSRQAVSKAKKNNQNSVVVLVGCYTEELGFTNSEYKLYDLALGNEEKKDIIKYIEEFKNNNVKNLDVTGTLKIKEEIGSVKRYVQKKSLTLAKNIRESIKIEDGCDNFCSYCIIPYTRGRVRSRDLNEIITEVQNLAKKSVKEIVLVGIEIASYGKDINEEYTLIDVIEKVNKVEGIERIRLGSIEPRWLTDENIKRLSNVSKLCPHFHLSIQSLSDTVLKRMNRKYTSKYILELVNKLKSTFKDSAITTDIIVGYIDETDEEFESTYKLSKEIGFSDMHIFKFSKREHTRAYNLPNSVSPKEATLRSNRLISLSKTMKDNYLNLMLGNKYSILVEEFKDGYIYGYTNNYVKVKALGEEDLWGKIVDLELISIEGELILGKLV